MLLVNRAADNSCSEQIHMQSSAMASKADGATAARNSALLVTRVWLPALSQMFSFL